MGLLLDLPAYCCGSCKQSPMSVDRETICAVSFLKLFYASITNIHVYLLLFVAFKSVVQTASHCFQCTTALGNVTCDPHCGTVCTSLPFLGVTWFVFCHDLPFLGVTWFVFCHDVKMFVLSGHVTVASLSRSHG